MKNFRLSIEKSEEMSFGCLVDQNDTLVASSFGSNSRILEKRLGEFSASCGGTSARRISHGLAAEMIRRHEGATTAKNAILIRSGVSTYHAIVGGVLEKLP